MFLQEQLKGIIIIEDFAHVSFGKACVVHVRCGKLHVISGACVHRLMQNRDTCNLFFQCKLSTSHVSSKYLLTCFQSVSSERCVSSQYLLKDVSLIDHTERTVVFPFCTSNVKRQAICSVVPSLVVIGNCCHRKFPIPSPLCVCFITSARVSARSLMSSRECVVYWYSIQ